MLKALIKLNLRMMIASMMRTGSKKKSSEGTKILIGLLMVYLGGCFIAMFTMLSSAMCLPLHKAGLDWFYFAVMGLVSVALNIVGGIFASKAVLFEAKDNETMLAMPIPPRYILTGRMMSLLLLDYAVQALVLLPAYFVYGGTVGLDFVRIFALAATFLVLPLLSLSINAVLGWLLAVISARLPFKRVITLLVYVGFLGGYFYVIGKANEYIQWMMEHGASLSGIVRKVLFPFYHMGMACGEGRWMSLILFFICALLPFAVVMVMLAKSFYYITTANKGKKKVRYQERSLKVSGVDMALLKKELSHFTSNASIMINAATGDVFILILLVLAVVQWDTLEVLVTMIPLKYIGGIAALALTFAASCNMMSAPAISIEGNRLWLMQTLPVEPIHILMAKVNMHIILGAVPIIIAGIVFNVMLPMTVMGRIMVFLLPLCFTVAQGFMGVIMNLKFPKLEWPNETAAVKQGASPVLTMLLSMALIGAPAVGYVVLFLAQMGWDLFLVIHCVILLAASVGMYFYLKDGGSRRFLEL